MFLGGLAAETDSCHQYKCPHWTPSLNSYCGKHFIYWVFPQIQIANIYKSSHWGQKQQFKLYTGNKGAAPWWLHFFSPNFIQLNSSCCKSLPRHSLSLTCFTVYLISEIFYVAIAVSHPFLQPFSRHDIHGMYWSVFLWGSILHGIYSSKLFSIGFPLSGTVFRNAFLSALDVDPAKVCTGKGAVTLRASTPQGEVQKSRSTLDIELIPCKLYLI